MREIILVSAIAAVLCAQASVAKGPGKDLSHKGPAKDLGHKGHGKDLGPEERLGKGLPLAGF